MVRLSLRVSLSALILASGLTACQKPAPAPVAAPVSPVAAAPAAPDTALSSAGDIATLKMMIATTPGMEPFMNNEAKVAAIRAAVLEPWRQALVKRDAPALTGLLATPTAAKSWLSSKRVARRTVDGITEQDWSKAAPAAAGTFADYIAGFSSVTWVDIGVPEFKDAATPAVTVDYDLRGTSKAGARREDRGQLVLTMVSGPAGWKIQDITPGHFETLEAAVDRRPRFEDATASAGLNAIPIVDRREAIRRGGYAIAESDYDGDGYADLLVGQWGPVQLFHNTGHGFEDVTKAAGLEGETLVKSAVFADLDNDGLKDLVLLRFIDKEKEGISAKPLNGTSGEGDLVAYRNLGNGKFERKGDVTLRHRHYDRSMPLAVADFDGDGTLDIYIGFPGSRDFTNNLARAGKLTDLAKQGLWLNDGHWHFTEATDDSGLNKNEVVYPHAALATDLDGDGKPDLIVVDDSGQLNPIYRNDGKGKFTDVTKAWGLEALGFGMGVTAGDYDGDGKMDLVMTEVGVVDHSRLERWREKFDADYKFPDNGTTRDQTVFLFHNLGNGKFEQKAVPAGIAEAGAGLAGAEWIDYNNDGHLDLYVLNGLWSGGDEDASAFLMQLNRARDLAPEKTPDPASSRPGDGREPNPMLSLLRNFRGSLADPRKGPISDKPTLSFGGYQHHRLFRNNGDGTFTDIAYFENADRMEDGYMLSAGDFDHDGTQDLILRNADPAPGRSYPTVVVLRGVASPTDHSLAVSVRGDKSNKDGVGAVVTAWVGTQREIREIHAVGGATQSDEVAFFGLGKATRADRLEVRWPSGLVEKFNGVAAGRVLLSEGHGLVTQASLTPAVKTPAVPN